MKKKWSSAWSSSKQPRKQRKFMHNAPLHVKRKALSVHLAPVLRERYGRRAVPVRKGDKIKVLTGEKKGFTGSVEKVSLKKGYVFVEGLKVKKVDGTEVLRPMKPSNLMITELNTDDKRRQAKIMKVGMPEKKLVKKENGPKKEAKSETKKTAPKKKATSKKKDDADKSGEKVKK